MLFGCESMPTQPSISVKICNVTTILTKGVYTMENIAIFIFGHDTNGIVAIWR